MVFSLRLKAQGPSACWSLFDPDRCRHCLKAALVQCAFPKDASDASRPSCGHALLTVVSTMPWQLRSSRLQRGSPRGSNQSASRRPPRTSVFPAPMLLHSTPREVFAPVLGVGLPVFQPGGPHVSCIHIDATECCTGPCRSHWLSSFICLAMESVWTRA